MKHNNGIKGDGEKPPRLMPGRYASNEMNTKSTKRIIAAFLLSPLIHAVIYFILLIVISEGQLFYTPHFHRVLLVVFFYYLIALGAVIFSGISWIYAVKKMNISILPGQIVIFVIPAIIFTNAWGYLAKQRGTFVQSVHGTNIVPKLTRRIRDVGSKTT